MNTTAFLKQCEDYFGRWQRVTVRTAMLTYLEKRTPAYLDVLWPMLRDGRSVVYGPPDIKAITDLHVDVSDALDLRAADRLRSRPTQAQLEEPVLARRAVTQAEIDSWSPIEGEPGDRWLSHEEAGQALALVFTKLKVKDDEMKAKAKEAREDGAAERAATKSWF